MPPSMRKARIPSAAEIEAAATELGIPLPVRGPVRSRVVATIQLAEQHDAADDLAAAVDPVPAIAKTYRRLIEDGLPDHAAALIVAALAPGIAARAKTDGAAHAPQ